VHHTAGILPICPKIQRDIILWQMLQSIYHQTLNAIPCGSNKFDVSGYERANNMAFINVKNIDRKELFDII